MTRKTMILALVLTLGAGGAMASSSGAITEETRTKITQSLTAQGYEVRKIEMEDGEIEVYAIKDGRKYELYLAPDLTIRRSNLDD